MVKELLKLVYICESYELGIMCVPHFVRQPIVVFLVPA